MTKILHETALDKELCLTFSSQDLMPRVQSYIEEKSLKVKIDGFRPGKAPLERLLQAYGSEALADAVYHLLIEKADAITQGKTLLEPMNYTIKTDAPPLKDFKDIPDLEVEVSCIFAPEVQEVDLKDVQLEDYTVKPDDLDVQKVLEEKAAQTLTSIALDKPRPSQKGDTVSYTMAYTQDKDVGTPHTVTGQFHLGQGLLPQEFEEALYGISQGESIAQRIRVPSDFHIPELANKKINVSITFDDIRQSVPYEVGEDFAKACGFETLAAMKEAVVRDLEITGKSLAAITKRKQLGRLLETKLIFDVPQGLVKRAQEFLNRQAPSSSQDRSQVAQESSQDADQDSASLEAESKKTPPPAKAKGASADADKNLKKALAMVRLDCYLNKVIADHDIQATDQEMSSYIHVMAQSRGVSFQEVANFLRKNTGELRTIMRSITERKALDHLAQTCQSITVETSVHALNDILNKESIA
jgi:trigger factor